MHLLREPGKISSPQKNSVCTHQPIPRHSMGLPYMPTLGWFWGSMGRHIRQSHGVLPSSPSTRGDDRSSPARTPASRSLAGRAPFLLGVLPAELTGSPARGTRVCIVRPFCSAKMHHHQQLDVGPNHAEDQHRGEHKDRPGRRWNTGTSNEGRGR